MGWSMQNKVENITYDLIFDFENEFGIDTGKIPEVYYVNKFSKFENLGIDKEYEEDFKEIIREKEAAYFPKHNLIISARSEEWVLAEEAVHFIHYQFLKNNDNLYDDFGASAISEMLGFFYSKLINPKRKNPYQGDCFLEKEDIKSIVRKINYTIKNNEYFELIHQQGYLAGDKFFYKYLNSEISKQEIKDLITKPLSQKEISFYTFIYWKNVVLKEHNQGSYRKFYHKQNLINNINFL